METNEENFYLKLEKEVKFEPVSKITNIFFDDSNKEIISVRSGGTMGVVVKSQNATFTFCMEDQGTISSIKFTPDHTVLAVQRISSFVELYSYIDGKLNQFCKQETRIKNANILGIIWLNNTDLVVISNQGVEIFQVSKEKWTVRFLKSYPQSCEWFLWSAECRHILISNSITPFDALFQPYSYVNSQIKKLPKFEVEIQAKTPTQGPSSSSTTNAEISLTERDVGVSLIYGMVSILILRHSVSASVPTSLDVYQQNNKDDVFRKRFVCLLELNGSFAFSVIDNLIVVHYHVSQISLLFDVKSSIQNDDKFENVFPIFVPNVESSENCQNSDDVFPIYSTTCVFFQPSIVIDACLGSMSELELRLDVILNKVSDRTKLVHFYMNRKDGKSYVIKVVLKEITENRGKFSLFNIFDMINSSYKKHLDFILQSQTCELISQSTEAQALENRAIVVIDQAEIYSSVFAPVLKSISEKTCHEGMKLEIFMGILLDYVHSLIWHGLNVPYYVTELIVNSLVATKQFFQLHQLLQYHVLPDSKPLACILLSLVGVYGTAEQLSLDMLARLKTASDEIVEILLSKKLVVQALRYVKSVGEENFVCSRKFIEAAQATEDPLVFFSIYTFFANTSSKNKIDVLKGEHYEEYAKHFEKLFGNRFEKTS